MNITKRWNDIVLDMKTEEAQSSKDLRRAINVVSNNETWLRLTEPAEPKQQHRAHPRMERCLNQRSYQLFLLADLSQPCITMPMSKQAMTLTWQKSRMQMTFRSTVRKARRAAKTCLSHASTKCCLKIWGANGKIYRLVNHLRMRCSIRIATGQYLQALE
jgi:hypothetical protein